MDSKDIKVTVILIDGATFFAKTGSGNHPGFAFNLKGDPAITVTGFDSTYWAYSSTNVTPTGGFGTFNNQLDLHNTSGTSDKISTLSFNIYDASGIGFSDFISNSYGNYFVADILGSNGGTGLSGISGDPVVHGNTPEPSSLILLGTGIMSAGVAARRRFAQATAKA